MRQRNDSPFEVHAWSDPVLVIGPGEVVDHPSRLTGLTLLLEDIDNSIDQSVADSGEKETTAATPDDTNIEEPNS